MNSPQHVLGQMLGGATAASLLYVAAELRLADLLSGGPHTTEKLVARTGANADALTRVLRGLAVLGIVSMHNHTVTLTELGHALRSDVPGSTYAAARLMGNPVAIQAWTGLLHTVQTGRPAFDHVFGTDFGSYFTQTPGLAQIFDAFMGGITANVAPAVVDAYDFSTLATIVDVGGNDGTLLRAILKANPSTRGFVFDLPHAQPLAERGIAADGLDTRCRFVAGNFFEPGSIPTADAYLLKSVLHDWDDAQCVSILEHVRAAMQPESKLLIVERAMPSDGIEPEVVMSDLTMLVMATGRERTAGEYRALLERSGLKLERVMPTGTTVNVLEARVA
jgi:hypothetical protein